MRPFQFATASTVDDALAAAAEGSAFLAGGTSLVDLLKLEVVAPNLLVDINALPLTGVRSDADGLHLAALERMADLAYHPTLVDNWPVLALALRGASPQIRNMATIAGNLLQRTRCGYFRDKHTACNKRQPGSGCAAIGGQHRNHAIFGTSDDCVATHPSDFAVALTALDASLTIQGAAGTRQVPLADFYQLPGSTPNVENTLAPGELITEITVPPLAYAQRSTYVKIRDRQSYSFALTSAAVALDVADGAIREARVAAGGVGTVPWRLPAVEQALVGRQLTETAIDEAAAVAAEGAAALEQNRFKTTLLRRTIVRAVLSLAG